MLEPSGFSGQAPFPRPTACIGMEEKSLDSAFWTAQSFARQSQTPQYEEVASAADGLGGASQAAPPSTAKGQNGTVVELVPGRTGKKAQNDVRALVETSAASDICGWHLAVVGRRPS